MSIDCRAERRWNRVARQTALAALMTGIAIAAVSCGSQPAGESANATAGSSSEPAATTTAATRSTSARAESDARATRPRQEAPVATRGGRIRLTDTGCVTFEPQWTTVNVGQSLTWTSAMKTPVTIHISGGAFDRSEYVVRPGGTISTSPARTSGSFTIWSEPTACQGPPRGIQGSGPGVTVEGPAGH